MAKIHSGANQTYDMYLIRTPNFIQSMFPNFTWRIPTERKELFLTFDDGPIPEVTPWVLDQLQQYDAKATFFCVGENAQRYPDIMLRLHAEGHSLGNHTHNHLSGWGTENMEYFHNVRKCARAVDSELFRPPYGRMKPGQAQFILRHYKIVMWDVLSGDFDPAVSEEQCLSNIVNNAGPGSIVVLHDSLKAEENLRYTLPRVLKHYAALGYTFNALSALQEAKALRKTA